MTTTADLSGELRSALDAMSDGACLSEEGGRLRYVNPAAERLLGLAPGAGQGRPLCELLCGRLTTPACPGGCAEDCALRDPESPERAVTFEGKFDGAPTYEWREFRINRQARSKDLRVRCLRLPSEEGASARHLTLIEDAAAEAELERRKEDWRAMVAHDLRSPLTGILGTLRLIADKPDGTGVAPEEKRLLSASLRSCGRLVELLDSYLEVARLDAGRMPVAAEAVPLLKTARRCAEEQEARFRELEVEVALDIPEDLAVTADGALLDRVLGNLLDNALKHSSPGSRVLLIAMRGEDESALLTVKDSGPGIAEEQLPRVFDRYYQARERRAGRTRGVGLGLAFCREALAAMGGEISVRSRVGAGSEFIVKLPVGRLP